MSNPIEPNLDPPISPPGQPAKEPPYDAGDHLPTRPDPVKNPPYNIYNIDDPHPKPGEGNESREAPSFVN
jgi:hypothetical protein